MPEAVAAPAAPAAAPTPAPAAPTLPTASELRGTTSNTPAPSDGPQSATPAPQSGETTPAAPKTYRLSVYGQEREIPADKIDAAAELLGIDPQELTRVSQLKAAAYQQLEQGKRAAQERAEMERAIREGDPWEVMKKFGRDPDQIAIERVRALMAQEAMSPEQRAFEQQKAELAKERAAIESAKRGQAEAQTKAQVQAHVQRFNAQLPEAMKQAGLPPTTDAARYVYAEMQRQAKHFGQVDVAWAAKEARAQFVQHAIPVVRSMPAAELVAALGPETIKAIQRFILGAPPPPVTPAPPRPPAQQPPGRALSPAEWREWNNR